MVLADFPPGSYLEVTSLSHDRRGAAGSGHVGDERVRYGSTHLVGGAYLRHWGRRIPAATFRGEPGDVELSLALRACPELRLRGQRNPKEVSRYHHRCIAQGAA